MPRSGLDRDGNASEGSDSGTPKNLPCPACPSLTFPSASKLNRHRNSHEKPYQCVAGDCSMSFSQRQALDRHILARHSDTNNPTRFYHCTVDGCKYSSTGRRRQKIIRLDQVKDHIKERGHYGPHSSSDRPRRPGEPLFTEYIILARFEEWYMDGNSDSKPSRTVKSWELNSLRTKLWHPDDTAESLLRYRNDPIAMKIDGRICSVWDCYYASQPPENCETVLFKTEKALQEHHRRAHDEAPALEFTLISQPQEPGPQDSSISDSHSVGRTSYSLGSELPSCYDMFDFDITTEFPLPEPADLGPACLASSHDVDYYCSPCSPGSSNTTCISNTPGADCFCQSCGQGVIEGRSLSHNELPTTAAQVHFSEPQYQAVYNTTRPDDLWIPGTGNAPSSDGYQIGSTSESNTSSLVSQNSQKLQTRRFACSIPLCQTTFRRKGDLTRHLESVHGPRAHSCQVCSRQFNRKDKLIEHQRNSHNISYSDTMKRRSMLSESTIFSTWHRLSSSERPSSGRDDVVPSETLMTPSSQSVGWTTGGSDLFRETSLGMSYEEQSSLLDGLGAWRTPPFPAVEMGTGTVQSPICISDESTPKPATEL